MKRLLKRKDLQNLLVVKPSKFYQIVKSDNFPTPIIIGRTKLWFEDEVLDWVIKQRLKG